MGLHDIAKRLHSLLRDKTAAYNGGYYFGAFTMHCFNLLITELKGEQARVARLERHRDELHIHSNEQLFEIRELRACLKWYVEHDDAQSHDEYYMAGQNRAKKILRMKNEKM